jgi:hypothetical protein
VGVYFANGALDTGTGGLQLHFRGSVVAANFSLQRNLLSNSDPSEKFEFGIDQASFLYPSFLGTKNIRWKEVAP